MPDRFPIVGLTREWYSGLALRLGDEYILPRARTPWVVLQHRRDGIGEHARWAMKTSMKYPRTLDPRFAPAWKLWDISEPAVDFEFFRVGTLERVLGWALVAWAIGSMWRQVLRGSYR